MLESLFGNQNIERVMLFLFVNGKCYGAQLQRAFGVLMTPIQNALERLEKGGIVVSCYEGRTRIYRYNSSHPLIQEIEALIKKRYALLSAEQKRRCHVVEGGCSFETTRKRIKILKEFWNALLNVKHLSFRAGKKLSVEACRRAQGSGGVLVSSIGDRVIVFNEKGSWDDSEGQQYNFTNMFRWTLDCLQSTLALEHLRRGVENPVFLFHLVPTGPWTLSSAASHLCGEDAYFGQLHLQGQRLCLKWRVIGGQKDEEIEYVYEP